MGLLAQQVRVGLADQGVGGEQQRRALRGVGGRRPGAGAPGLVPSGGLPPDQGRQRCGVGVEERLKRGGGQQMGAERPAEPDHVRGHDQVREVRRG